MRDGWTETTLGDVAKWGSGGTPKSGESSYYDGDIPWCVIGDLTEREVFLTEKCITSEGLKNSSAKIVEPGAVMIAMYGASIGRTGIVGRPMATNQAIAFAYPNVGTLDNRFLLCFLQTQKLQFVEAGQGAAQPNISQTVLKAWPMILPPLVEQRRIVDVVSAVDDYVNALQQKADTARIARKAVLHELLSAGGDDWTEFNLGDIADVLDRLRKPISGSEREKRIGDVPYYGATGQAGWIDKPIFDEELVLLGEDAIDFLNPDVHKAYLISGPSWVNNHAHVLRAKREKVLSFFLMEALNAVDYSQFVAFGTRSKLTQGAMMGISVQVPPLVKQKQIVEIVSSVDDVIRSTEQAVTDAKNLRSGLLSDLLSGEHEIPASYDLSLGAA
jgi:type I restriction enzyme S subunit